MKQFNDEWSDDLSEFNILSFEEVSQGFSGKENVLKDISIHPKGSPYYRSKLHDIAKTPHGKTYKTDQPVSAFPCTGQAKDGTYGYEYFAYVSPYENGSDVYKAYKDEPNDPYSLALLYEKPNPNKSNFAGDFYIADFGEKMVEFYEKTIMNNNPKYQNGIPCNIEKKFFMNVKSLEDDAKYLKELAKHYEKDNLNESLILAALQREYTYRTKGDLLFEITGDILSIPSDAIGWIAEKLEKIKPQEHHYKADVKDFSPVLFPAVVLHHIEQNDFASSQLFEKAMKLIKNASDSIANAVIDHLPSAMKKLVEKISNIIDQVQMFLSDITSYFEEWIKEKIYLMNAFVCGVIDGIVGLVQSILYILQFLLQPTVAYSYEQYLEKRANLEKIEDITDWLSENIPQFLEGIKALFSNVGTLDQRDLKALFKSLADYFGDISKYTLAFYAGVLVFEIVINILLLIFTEGIGNIAKGATALQKAGNLLKVLAREAISVVTMGLSDVLRFFTRFITKFVKVCQDGFSAFIRWIRQLFRKMKNANKAEDLLGEAHEIEEVVIRARRLQKGAGDITKSFAENAGIKINRWISENKVFGQSTDHTCVATSLKMVLEDKNIVKSETYLAEALNTDKNGARIKDIPEALYNSYLDDVVAIYESKIKLPKLVKKLGAGDKAIVSIGTKEFGSHAVVLEKIENGKVFLRDPLPIHQGKSYIMKTENFQKIFKDKAVIIKK